ncbi:MAG TPA: hypothetical protein DEQ80_01015 [Anaerolinea thermolimosa]|uniref:Glycosyltransferase subfamily 4-like N-terminal domain-containing protein n=1 Tax=Anaerolinea thermolimosa TaxID=229919 RepID=A0A3D1JFN5_9CHLR|nr:hypothetical protein [Anaerolinea thermolimosa]
MRIILVHNYHREWGGSDAAARQDALLLKNYGHTVIEFSKNNREADSYNFLQKISLPINIIWSYPGYAQIKQLILDHRPDIVHVHDSFPLISPSIYDACAQLGVPTILTLHDYRLLCPRSTFYRDGAPCEKCRESVFQSVRFRCNYGYSPVTQLLPSPRRRRAGF